MFDSWESALAVVVAILIAYAVVLSLGMVVWSYRDIRQRTHDGWSQAVAVALVALFSVAGLVLYLILRPSETLVEAQERRLENEALLRDLPERRACPRCDRAVRDDFLLCPHCRTTLREPCLGCGRALELSWTACPYCGAQGPQAMAAPQPAREAAPAAAPQASGAPSTHAAGTGTPTPGSTARPS